MKPITLLISLTLILSACNQAAPTLTPLQTETKAPPVTSTATPLPDYDQLVHLFDYDPSVPLDVRIGDATTEQGVTVQTIRYAAPDDCRVSALLFTPDGPGPYPAVIYMHAGGRNKTQYYVEAKLLAGQGVVSLLLDSPFETNCLDSTRQGYIRTVLFVRRGVDLLESLPQVDRSRIAYVGHSFGATWGGVIAGVEPRIHFFVLMAGYAQVSKNDTPEVPDLDAILYVGHAGEAAFLFQFAEKDEYIRPEEARQYYAAASGEKSIVWYDTTHFDLQEAGQPDRLGWLADHLGFPVP
jgi:dienelactone hydrolase